MTSPYLLPQYMGQGGFLQQYEPQPLDMASYSAASQARAQALMDEILKDPQVISHLGGMHPRAPMAQVGQSQLSQPLAQGPSFLERIGEAVDPYLGILGLIHNTLSLDSARRRFGSNRFIDAHGQQADVTGALRSYGIESASNLEEQMQQLAQARQQAAQHAPAGTAVGGQLTGIAAGLPLGVVEAVPEMFRASLNMLSRLPGGEAAARLLDKVFQTNQVREQFAQLNETVRKGLPAQAQYAFNEMPLLNPVAVGKFIGMTPLNVAAYKAAGTVLEGVGLASLLGNHPILLGAAQGATGGLALTAGENMPWLPSIDQSASSQDQAMQAVFGNRFGQSVFGGILGAAYSRFYEHVANSPAMQLPAPRISQEQYRLKVSDLGQTYGSTPEGRMSLEAAIADAHSRGDTEALSTLQAAHAQVIQGLQPGTARILGPTAHLFGDPATGEPWGGGVGAQPGAGGTVYPEGAQLPSPAAQPRQPAYTVEDAPAAAAQLTKQATVMQSPVVEGIAEATDGLRQPVDDVDVIMAAHAKLPAGTVVTQNVVDVQPIMQAAEAGHIPSTVQVVPRPDGKVDVLTSSTGPLDAAALAMYQEHGVFPGMRMKSIASGVGKEGIVVGVESGKSGPVVRWRKPGAEPIGAWPDGAPKYRSYTTSLENVQPHTEAPSVIESPVEWQEFKDYAQARMGSYELLSEGGRQELPRMVQEFLDEKGISDPVTRDAYLRYFDTALVHDYRALEPEINAKAAELSAAAHEAAQANESSGFSVGPNIHDRAAAKGFTYDDQWNLHDKATGQVFPFSDPQAAEAFLRGYNRDLPTVDLPTVVPAEVMEETPAMRVSDSRPPEEHQIAVSAAWMNELETEMESAALAEDRAKLARYQDGSLSEYEGRDHELTQDELIDIGLWQKSVFDNPASSPETGTVPPAGGFRPTTPPSFDAAAGAPRPVRVAVAVQHRGDLEHRTTSFLARAFTPVRTTYARLEEQLHNLGITVPDAARNPQPLRPWAQYDEVMQAVRRSYNESYDYHQQRADLMSQIHSLPIRNGRVWRVLSAAGDDRMVEASRNTRPVGPLRQALGFDDRVHPEEVAALDKVDHMMNRALSDDGDQTFVSGSNRWEQIKRYVTQTGGRQIAEYPDPYGSSEQYPQIGWFVTRAKDHAWLFKTPDAQKIIDDAIASWYYDKHVSAPLESMVDQWRKLGKMRFEGDEGKPPLAVPAAYVDQWARTLQGGYNPESDWALEWAHGLLNTITPVTRGQTKQIINGLINAKYRSAMGWRPANIIRNATQPLLASPFVGMENLGSAYTDVLNPETRSGLYERAFQIGSLEKGKPPVEGVSLSYELGLREGELRQANPVQQTVRDLVVSGKDFARDLLPADFRTMSGTKLDPLYFFTKGDELNRVVTGEAAWRRFQQELAVFQRGQQLGSGPSVQQFVDHVADGLEKSVRTKMAGQMASGDWDGAGYTFAREVTNSTQFVYGQAQQAPMLRTTTAQLGTQFGSYSMQGLNLLARTMANGSWRMQAKFASLIGLTSAMALTADAYTGWSFAKWLLIDPRWAGSPMMGFLKKVYNLAQIPAHLTGSHEQAQTLQDAVMMPFDVANSLDPFDALRKHTGALLQMNESPTPGMDLARYMVTGDQPNTYWKDRFNTPVDQLSQPAHGSLLPSHVQGQPTQGQLNPNAVFGGASPSLASYFETAHDLGVDNESRIYEKNGRRVVDTSQRDAGGHVPTHNVDAPSGRHPGETWEQYEARALARKDWSGADTALHNEISMLAPDVQSRVHDLISAAIGAGVRLRSTETYRSQDRQELLFQMGRSQPGGTVTWTLTSNHTPGRAVDFDVSNPRTRTWLQMYAPIYGFTTLGDMDPGHVEMPKPSQQPSSQRSIIQQASYSPAGAGFQF